MNAARQSQFAVALLCMALSLAGWSRPARAGEPLPDNERLNPVRAELQGLVDGAAQSGLPTKVLVGKIREGLAKGASPELIVGAVQRLTRDLGEANQFLRAQRRPGASSALLQAVAETHAAGVAWESATPLMAANADEGRLTRAFDVLAELARRGYPDRPAGLLLREVIQHDPSSLGLVVPGLESIRRGQTVSRADALALLGKNLQVSSESFEGAVNRSLEGREHGAAASNGKNGDGNDHAGGASKKGLAKGMK